MLEHRGAPYFTPDVVDALSDAVEEPYGTFVAVLDAGSGGARPPRSGDATWTLSDAASSSKSPWPRYPGR